MKSILKLYFVLNLATTLALAKPQYQSGTNGFGAGGQTNQFGSQENIPTTYSKKWLKITQKANFMINFLGKNYKFVHFLDIFDKRYSVIGLKDKIHYRDFFS